MKLTTCHRAGKKTRGLAALSLLVGLFASGCGVAGRNYNMQGVRMYQQGQHHAAAQKFQQAINRRPNEADGYYNLAATYHQRGARNTDQSYLKQSETLYNQALQYDPNHTGAYRGLAVLLVETGRRESALRLLEGWSNRQPYVADAKVELARLHEEFDNKEAAKRYLEDALVSDTNNARAWAALAKLREEAGDDAQSLANYQRSYQINSLQPQVAERIASLQKKMGVTAAPAPVAGTRVAAQLWVPKTY